MRNQIVFAAASLSLLLAQPVFAGGGLISTEVYPNSGAQNFNVPIGEEFIVRPQVNLNNEDPYDQSIKWCKNCPIKIKLENSQEGDLINQSSDKTDDNGQVYAKVISRIQGVRYVYSEVTLPSGEVYTGSKNSLNYAPTQIYNGENQNIPTSTVPSQNIVVNNGQIATPPKYPIVIPSASVVIVRPYPSVTPNLEQMPKVENEASLEVKVNELEKKLEESQRNQSILEQKLNDLIAWIKGLFT